MQCSSIKLSIKILTKPWRYVRAKVVVDHPPVIPFRYGAKTVWVGRGRLVLSCWRKLGVQV